MSKKLLLEGFEGKNGYSFTRNYDGNGLLAAHLFRDGKLRSWISLEGFEDIEEHALAKYGLWPASNGSLVIAREWENLSGSRRFVSVFDPKVPGGFGWIEGEAQPSRAGYDPGDEWKSERAMRGYEAAQEYFAAHPKEVAQ